MSQNAHLSEPDPQLMEILSKMSAMPPQRVEDIHVSRQVFVDQVIKPKMDRLKPLLPADSEYRVQDYKVPVEGGEITVRALTPTPGGKFGAEKYPLLVYNHLSGYRICDINLDDYDMRIRCVELKIVILLVGYRLVPEHPFPAAPEDCYAGLKWAADHASEIGADLKKGFIAGGASVGAGMATAAALRARDDPFFQGRRLTAQLLDYPATIHPVGYSHTKYKSELTSLGDPACDMPGFMDANELNGVIYRDYKPVDPTDFRASPLLHPNHKGLPPTAFKVFGKDPFRDDGIVYEKVLRENGVQTKIHYYSGMPHAFHHVFYFLDKAKRFEEEWREDLKWLLSFSK